MPITTELELRRFLSSKDVPCHEVEVLSGGTANFCWRIKTLLGRTSIIKHAESYIRSNASFAFPSERMDYEHLALTTIAKVISQHQYVQVPQVFHYFQEEHVLDMFDGGQRHLKDGYIKDSSLDIPKIAARVGEWAAALHNETSDVTVLDSLREKFDNEIAKSIYRFSYNNVAASMEEYGFDRTLGERINETYGSKLATDQVCLCHGDFWPGNFLLDDPPEKDDKSAPTLTLVDWEMVRIGNGATDVGQFAAEAWLLDICHGGKGMLDSFLNAYLGKRKLSDEDKIRVAVQFGVHIAYWPSRVPWADAKETKNLIAKGVQVLEAVEANEVQKLREGPLKALFQS